MIVILLSFRQITKAIFYLVTLWICHATFANEPNSMMPLIWSVPNSMMPLIWSVPNSNEYFIGRQQELTRLNSLMKHHYKVMIVGAGGIGKTQLAKKYIYDNVTNYQIIWWFDKEKNIEEQLRIFAKQLNEHKINNYSIQTEKISISALLIYIKDALRKTDKSWLLIFDNVGDLTALKEYIPEVHGRTDKHILITSRNANELIPALQLNKFSTQESIEFLEKTTNIKEVVKLTKIAETLNFYPIALAQAAAYIKSNNLSIDEYLKLYHSSRLLLSVREQKLLESNIDYFDLNQKSVDKTINMNLEAIKKESNKAYTIAEVIGLIGNSLIPETLLRDMLIKQPKDEDEYIVAIRILKKSSLIEERLKGKEKYYQMHDLVKTIAREKLLYSNNKATVRLKGLYNDILHIIYKYLDRPWGDSIAYINANTDLMNIAKSVVENAYEAKIDNPLLLKVIVLLLEHNNMIFHTNSDYIAYQQIAEKGFNLLTNPQYEVDSMWEARYYINGIYVDFIYSSQSLVKLYEHKLLKSLSMLEKSNDAYDTLFLGYISIVKIYIFKSHLRKASKYIKKAYSILNKINSNTYKSDFWYTLTWLNIEKGDYKAAKESIDSFFNITQQPNHYLIHLYAINMRASINFYLNNLQEALLWAEKCYEEAKNFFQSTTSNVSGEALITMARIYKAKKEYLVAKQKIESAIKVLATVFGGEDIDLSQAVAHTLLGEIYAEQGQYKEAHEEYTFAEKYYNRIHKDKISLSKEVGSLYADFCMLGIKIHNYGLVRDYLDLLIKKFSLEHPRTQEVMEEILSNNIILDA